MNIDELRQAAEDAADEKGMCDVTAKKNGVTDNGHKYDAGQKFHMHKALVPVHAQAGQVALTGNPKSETRNPKSSGTPSDKQVVGSADK